MTDQALPPEFTHGAGFFGYRGITLVRGEGARLYDETGKEFWDLGASYGCGNVGHSHPRVVAALEEQARRLVHAIGLFGNDTRSGFVEALVARMPRGLDRVFLSNSGTESIEAALKISMHATGRSGVVALDGGFHGRTMGALAATHKAAYREPFQSRLGSTVWVPPGDEALLEKAVTEETACVIAEPVQGEAGVRPLPLEYVQALRRRCDDVGALLVVDEVQTGVHRTGPFLGIEHYGVTPDVVCMAKSLAAGLPLGATVFRGDLGPLPEGLHGSTFGGAPLACAAARAVLDIVDEERLGERSATVGAHALTELGGLTELDGVAAARGRGLMLAVELTDRATPVLKRLQNLGFLALPAGPNTVRLLPPLNIPEDALSEGIAALGRIVGARSA